MSRTISNLFCSQLNDRRKRLGMSMQVVAGRAEVSLPTVQRILGGRYARVSFGHVARVAQALGVEFGLSPSGKSDIQTMRQEQAYAKARRLVALAQGTSALEAQGVDRPVLEEAIEQTAHELLRSKRKLWAR